MPKKKIIEMIPVSVQKPYHSEDVLVLLQDSNRNPYYAVATYNYHDDIWSIRIGSNVHMVSDDMVISWSHLNDM